MIDTPVIVRTLADGKDLILQGVGVIADHTELDVDGHSVLLVWVCFFLNLKTADPFYLFVVVV